uniref:non-specific serine/threonine protein kinase n=1 Tax=Daphnia magna TaxID=35525 RepID=A0A0N7ZVQ9_9CRUS
MSATKVKSLLPPPSVESSFSSSGSCSAEGSVPSDCSAKTSPGTSPAHLPRNRPKSMIPKIQLPPRPSTAQLRPANKHRLSLGKPVSLKEIRSSSVGNAPVKEDQFSNESMEVKRRNSKGTNGHIRSSSLSNGRDRLSLYAPSYSASEESCSEKSREEISELMTHSLITTTGASNNNDKLAKNRKPLALKSAEKKARKVKFYRNGDRFFKGVTLAVSAEKYRTFDSLLSELNRLVGDRVNLHQGVRFIFTTDGSKINTIDELQDGECYVCASSDQFKKLEYTKCAGTTAMRRSRITYGQGAICREASMISGLDQWKERRNKNHANNNSNGASSSVYSASMGNGGDSSIRWAEYMKPRLITIIRNGSRPRKAVRLLLNKKTAFTYEQVLSDITEAIRPDSGTVRKLYTADGRQVGCLADFFGPDFIFIAYGNEKFSHDDFDLTSNEIKYLPPFIARSPMNTRRGKSGSSRTGYTGGTSQTHRSPSNGRAGGSMGKSMVVGVAGVDVEQRPRDSSLPRVYEDPDELASSNQMVVDVPIVVEIRYEVGRIIGDGNFAVVREGIDRRTRDRFALKLIDKKRCQGKEVVLESEVQVLGRLRHPNVVKLYDVIDANSILCLVLELVEGGDLFDAIAAAGKFSEPEAKRMTFDLASALSYLHSLNIVHRDVKPENLFVVNLPDGMRSLKLGDFGLAEETHQLLYTVCGTPTYVAPEILLETGYWLKVDVWAMGVIVFILLCGYPPFVSPTNDQEELFETILAGHFEFASPYWDDASQMAKDMITLMLQTDPELRFSAMEVLQHPWLTEDEDWPDTQQCSRLGLHFDTSPSATELSAAQATAKKSPKSLITTTALEMPLKFMWKCGSPRRRLPLVK